MILVHGLSRWGARRLAYSLSSIDIRVGNVIPLAMLNVGEEGIVVRVFARRGMRSKIAGMNIVPGVRVRVLWRGSGGIMIQIGESRFAIGFGMAMKIYVRRI